MFHRIVLKKQTQEINKMNIQTAQLLIMAGYALLSVAAYLGFKRNIYLGLVPIVIGLILFAVSPVKTKQEGVAKIEREYQQEDTLPKRVDVKDADFDVFHQQSFDQLKKTQRA